jgi:hypothetical protein
MYLNKMAQKAATKDEKRSRRPFFAAMSVDTLGQVVCNRLLFPKLPLKKGFIWKISLSQDPPQATGRFFGQRSQNPVGIGSKVVAK